MITVIIAAYNAQSTIKRAIKSALAEPEITQIIVVDDASTDDTARIARGCDDGAGRLNVVVQDKNAGPSAARNRALAVCNTPWVTILDSDDFILAGRMAGLLAHTDVYDFIADDMFQVQESAVDGPRRLLLGDAVTLPMQVSFTDFVASNVTQKNRQRAELGFIKPLMRKSFLDQHHLHYQEHMRLGEDYELYARALGLGARMILIPAQGYVSVVRPNSLSGAHSEHDLLQLRECDTQLDRDLTLSQTEKKALRAHYLSVDCRLQWRNLILAVKHRDVVAAMRTFCRPLPVPFYVMEQLWEQFKCRVLNKKVI